MQARPAAHMDEQTVVGVDALHAVQIESFGDQRSRCMLAPQALQASVLCRASDLAPWQQASWKLLTVHDGLTLGPHHPPGRCNATRHAGKKRPNGSATSSPPPPETQS